MVKKLLRLLRWLCPRSELFCLRLWSVNGQAYDCSRTASHGFLIHYPWPGVVALRIQNTSVIAAFQQHINHSKNVLIVAVCFSAVTSLIRWIKDATVARWCWNRLLWPVVVAPRRSKNYVTLLRQSYRVFSTWRTFPSATVAATVSRTSDLSNGCVT